MTVGGQGFDTFAMPGRPVVVIDPDPKHRDALSRALSWNFRVRDYADFEAAVARTNMAPVAVLVGDGATAGGKPLTLRALRNEPVFKGAPVVRCQFGAGTVQDDDPDARVDCRIGTSAVMRALSALLDKTVEKSWDNLPPGPRSALRRTLDTFRNLGSMMVAGTPLRYEEVSNACGPVVEVVRQAGAGTLLDGLRDHNDIWYVHSVRVSTLMALFGHTIGLGDDELMLLAAGGLVHDLGKMRVPPEITQKVGELTPDETAKARRHVDATIEYLEKSPSLPKGVVAIAAQHHECLDGSGYPKGLQGSEINDLARIGAIVDVFAALTERRPYRAAMHPLQAIEVMQETVRAKLDQSLVRLFRDMLLKAAAA